MRKIFFTLTLSLVLTACDEDSKSCNDSAQNAQIADLSGKLEACKSDLSRNAPSNGKAGSRIKVYNYVGSDGSVWPAPYIYDSVAKEHCTLLDLRSATEYGCNNAIYCQSTNEREDVESDIPQEKHYWISACYDKFLSSQWLSEDVTITSNNFDFFLNFNDKFVLVGSSYNAIGAIENKEDSNPRLFYKYYNDAACTVPLMEPFFRDSNRIIGADTIFLEFNVSLKYYKPKQTTPTKVYEMQGNACAESTGDAILLEEIPKSSLTSYVEEAKANLKSFCSQICTAINKKAAKENWVEIHTEDAK